MEPVFVRPKEAARLLGVSMFKVYSMLRSGEMPSTRVTGVRLIPTAWLRELEQQAMEDRRD